jgi:hypothetical protein
MEIFWSLLVCIAGLILFIITPGPTYPAGPPAGISGSKFNVIGLYMFWVGLWVFLIQIGPHMVGFAGK